MFAVYLSNETNKQTEIMTNLSLFQVLDTVQTIAFDTEQGKRGEFILKNANFLRNPETNDRDRRAAFKTLIRLTKEVYNFGKGFQAGDKSDLEQAYYMLQAFAVQDRSAK